MTVQPAHDVASREELLAEMNGAAARQMALALKGGFDAMDNENVAPYPAGLNDCVSGLKWLRTNSTMLNIDTSRIVAAADRDQRERM